MSDETKVPVEGTPEPEQPVEVNVADLPNEKPATDSMPIEGPYMAEKSNNVWLWGFLALVVLGVVVYFAMNQEPQVEPVVTPTVEATVEPTVEPTPTPDVETLEVVEPVEAEVNL